MSEANKELLAYYKERCEALLEEVKTLKEFQDLTKLLSNKLQLRIERLDTEAQDLQNRMYELLDSTR